MEESQAQECVNSLQTFNMVMFVNPLANTRRNGVPVIGLRVKEFKADEKNNPASIFAQTVANWEELQLRFAA